MKENYILKWIDTDAGKIPIVSTHIGSKDRWGTIKVRLAINRLNYTVEPGIYAVGNPDADSIVLVSANYKLSFDTLRKELKGLNAWILVIDTKGINVWCAAGKGTFGTDELVNRVGVSQLGKIVNHRKLIVPQLGAPGIAAHEVKKNSGFTVIYGPVRAKELPAFLNGGMKATREMRQVEFSFLNRLLLIPVELVLGGRYLVFIIVAFFLLGGLNAEGFSVELAGSVGLRAAVNLVLAYLAGGVLGPLLLPWLPARAFFIKGFFTGIMVFIVSLLVFLSSYNLIEFAAWLLLIPAISSFLTMNFTGASTYTSLSGVKKEMRIAVPLQLTVAIFGSALWLADRFI